MRINKSFVWLGIIAVIAAFAYQSYLKRNPIEKDVDYEEGTIDQIESMMVVEPESEYLGNQLENGSSPFDVLYGKGQYADTDHSLLVRNQSSSDVIFMLENVNTGKIIRNEYIRAHSSFDLTKIPEGTFVTKYYYGMNWNPTRKVKNTLTGGFDNDEQFVISDASDDLMNFQTTSDDQYIYYADYEIVLETLEVEGNAMQERSIKPSEFF